MKFEASSLKYLYTINLEQKKQSIQGTFKRSEYGVNEVKFGFEGDLISSQDGVKKYKITFSSKDLKRNGPPYSMPSKKKIIWSMVKTRDGSAIKVKMLSKVYLPIPHWKLAEVEFDQGK